MTIDGKLSCLNRIYVFAYPPLYVSVPYIELYGIDAEAGNEVYERINNS